MIRVPIKSYLRKFLIGKIQKEKIQLRKITDAEISKETNLTRQVELMYEQKIANIFFGVGLFKTKQGYNDLVKKHRLNDYIGIQISDNMVREKYIYIDMRSVCLMNSYIYDWFVYDLQVFCDGVLSADGKFQDAIIEYMNKYDIEFEDITFEAMKRCYYRNRQKSKKIISNKSIASQLILNLSLSEKLKK